MIFAPNSCDGLSLRQLLDADWRRLLEFSGQQDRPRQLSSSFSARFACITLLRMAYVLHRKGWSRVSKLISLLNFIIHGIEIPSSLPIGPGLVIPHTQGIVIGAGYIGTNVTIYQQVTLGARFADFSFDPALRPHVCDGVIITSGAKIIGPYRLGANCIIGANAVVMADVPADHIAVGVPARFIDKSQA